MVCLCRYWPLRCLPPTIGKCDRSQKALVFVEASSRVLLCSHDLFILVCTLVNKERSRRNMIFSISHICQAFNLSSICVSLFLYIGWLKCLSGQNGDCLSVCGKEGVLWGILLTSGWEGLVYVFPSFLSLMHIPAYQQFGSFIVILITFIRPVHQQGGTPENVTTTSLLYFYDII